MSDKAMPNVLTNQAVPNVLSGVPVPPLPVRPLVPRWAGAVALGVVIAALIAVIGGGS